MDHASVRIQQQQLEAAQAQVARTQGGEGTHRDRGLDHAVETPVAHERGRHRDPRLAAGRRVDGGDLRTIAREILVGQNIEIGRMIQLLRDYGKPEVSDSDLAMSWMDEPFDVDRMPGLATQSDIDALVAASGAEADRVFVQLMIAHHQGGIHMAAYAKDHAGTAEVRLMASQMASGQQEEIVEMRNLLARTQGGT